MDANYQGEYHSFIETFLSWEDAVLWAEHRLKPYNTNEWDVKIEIRSVNGAFRVGFSVTLRQKSLNLEGSD